MAHLNLAKKNQGKRKISLRYFYSKLANVLLSFLCCGLDRPRFIGVGSSKKFGVINQDAFLIMKKLGIKEAKMSIVGYLDFALAEKAAEQFSESQAKQNLALKYNLNLNKKNIIIYSSSFNAKDAKLFSNEEQIAYYKEIIKTIREVFSEQEANILFKIHPSESIDFYKSLEQYGVKIYGKEVKNEELILLSDLYIAHYSTTNFTAMILQKPAIFLNLLKAEAVEITRELFGIKEYVKEKEKFKQLLSDFKNNRLQAQYELSDNIYTANSLEKILNWIEN